MREIKIGKNVFFVGTVNVDESTYHFSDKVLDRANVIKLHNRNFSDLKNLLSKEKKDILLNLGKVKNTEPTKKKKIFGM